MSKRWFAVVLLLAASVEAGAQGASAFMQGVGLRMGAKDGDNVAIPNAPFQADVVVTLMQTLSDGNVLNREIRGKVQRDGAGRFRWQGADTTGDGKVKPDGWAQSIVVDPVAKRTLMWTSLSKDIRAGPVVEGSRISLEYASYNDGREHLRKDIPDDVTSKDLGTKKISGLVCMVTLVTTIVPVGKMGNEKPIVITDESWHSVDLQMVVERMVKDPLIGTRRVEFQNITRSEPEPSTFQPPDGYKEHFLSMPPPGMPPLPGVSTSPNF